MLSINGGTKRVCIACFEKGKMNVELLDDHDHAPYSPTNMVPFHPFTKRYANRLATQLFESDGSDSEYKPDDESDSSPTKKKKKKAVVVSVPKKKGDEDTAKTTSSAKKTTAVVPAVVSVAKKKGDEDTAKTTSSAKKTTAVVPPRKKARVDDTTEPAAVDTDGDEEEDDGVRLDTNLIKTPAVEALLGDHEYVYMAKMTAKARAVSKKKKEFAKMRKPVRVSAAAARRVYADAAKAQPDTPDVTMILQVTY